MEYFILEKKYTYMCGHRNICGCFKKIMNNNYPIHIKITETETKYT